MGKNVENSGWEQAPDADKIVASARSAIACILGMGNDVLEEHKKVLISRMIWKITEAHGKYNTRYCSEKALKASKDDRRHDHVWTRKLMVERILEDPGVLEHEVQLAIGCIVTKAEHSNLTEFDKMCDGWERYKMAGIAVLDLKENTRISDAWK